MGVAGLVQGFQRHRLPFMSRCRVVLHLGHTNLPLTVGVTGGWIGAAERSSGITAGGLCITETFNLITVVGGCTYHYLKKLLGEIKKHGVTSKAPDFVDACGQDNE